MISDRINGTDRKIMILRALGYRQKKIAEELKITQPAVSQRIEKIRKLTKDIKDYDKAFWQLLIGETLMKMFERIIKKR